MAAIDGDGAGAWEQDGVAAGEVREIIGAVDETFLEQMILVFQDVTTGYIVQEEVADDRTYATWKALVDERLKALGTSVLYLVSDRAKALIQLAEQGLECLSMPDFFHLVHEIVKSYSLALGRRVRQAHKDLTEAEEALARLQGRPQAAHDVPEAEALVDARQAEVHAMGRGAAHVSAPPRDPLAHAASLQHRGLGSPDLRPGRKPTANGS